MLFLHGFDKIPKQQIYTVVKDLKDQFPEWHKNPYYRELRTSRGRAADQCMMAFLALTVRLYQLDRILRFSDVIRKIWPSRR